MNPDEFDAYKLKLKKYKITAYTFVEARNGDEAIDMLDEIKFNNVEVEEIGVVD